MRLLFLFLLLLPFYSVRAQSPARASRVLDSLRQMTVAHPADTFGTRALTRLLVYYLYRDTSQARQYGEKALALATQLHDTTRLANITYNLGTLTGMSGQPQRSIAYHEASGRYFMARHNVLWAGHNDRNIGYRYITLAQYPTAMRYLLRSLTRRTAAADSAGIADSYAMLGQVYISLHNYPAAQAAYEQALQRWRRLGAGLQVANALNHLAIIQREEKHYAQAQHYLDQGFALARTDSAMTFNLLLTLGVLHQRQGRWAASLPLLRRAERLAQQNPALSADTKSDLLSILGEALVQTRQAGKAAPYMQQALALSRKSQTRQEEIDALEGMAEVAAARKDYVTAFSHERARGLLNDSLHAVAVAKRVVELQIRYETVEKEARIQVQAAQLRAQQQLISRRNTQLLAGAVVAGLLAALAYLAYTRYRLRQRLEHEQERQQQLHQRVAAVLAAEENERRRIGADLHDSLGQLLAAAQLNLHALRRELGTAAPPTQHELLSNAAAVVDESVREMRGISHNLMPNALLLRGLGAAVRDFLDKLPGHHGLRAEVQVFGLEARLDPTVESVLFRVVQELVQNIIKHAQATEITLQLVQSDTELTIVVEDNGIGFAAHAPEIPAGLGIRNIHSRVAYLGGQVHFDSAPGRGTTVALDVPLTRALAG